jgi:hypothetical protein
MTGMLSNGQNVSFPTAAMAIGPGVCKATRRGAGALAGKENPAIHSR